MSGRGDSSPLQFGVLRGDAAAGFYAHGTLYFPMRKGLATVVAYADGHVNVVDWQGGSVPPPDVVVARQNLSLLVDRGAATALVDDGASWGLTLHGATRVWRTGLGIDSSGNLIYAAAPDQTAGSLASILIAAGAVRAMELDINPEWPIFVTSHGPGATGPRSSSRIPTRSLTGFCTRARRTSSRCSGGSQGPNSPPGEPWTPTTPHDSWGPALPGPLQGQGRLYRKVLNRRARDRRPSPAGMMW